MQKAFPRWCPRGKRKKRVALASVGQKPRHLNLIDQHANSTTAFIRQGQRHSKMDAVRPCARGGLVRRCNFESGSSQGLSCFCSFCYTCQCQVHLAELDLDCGFVFSILLAKHPRGPGSATCPFFGDVSVHLISITLFHDTHGVSSRVLAITAPR